MTKEFVLFDTIVDYMPQTRVRLSPAANIVESVTFEAALVRIQQTRVNDLSEDEQAVEECLFKSEFETSTSCREELSITDISSVSLKRSATIRKIIEKLALQCQRRTCVRDRSPKPGALILVTARE